VRRSKKVKESKSCFGCKGFEIKLEDGVVLGASEKKSRNKTREFLRF